MAQRNKSHEARIAALEAALEADKGNPVGITLKEHFESRLHAVERATDLAATAMDKRLNGMNEFRETLRDQASKFITREEMNAALKVVIADVEANKTFRNQMEGKASATAVYIGYALSTIGIIIAIVALLSG